MVVKPSTACNPNCSFQTFSVCVLSRQVPADLMPCNNQHAAIAVVLLRPSRARPAEAPSRRWLQDAGGQAGECDLQAGWAPGHKRGLCSAAHPPGVLGAPVPFPGLAKPPKCARAEGRAPEMLSWEVGSPAQGLKSPVGAHPALLAAGLCIPSLHFASVFGRGAMWSLPGGQYWF